MSSDPPLHVALGPDLRRPSVRLLKLIPRMNSTGIDRVVKKTLRLSLSLGAVVERALYQVSRTAAWLSQ